jgi:cytolysin-activating lysine-acyltransferase
MRKRKKAKATASDATEPGLASQSATPAIDSPSPAGSSGEAVTGCNASARSTKRDPEGRRTLRRSKNITTIVSNKTSRYDARSNCHDFHALSSAQTTPLADLEWLVLPAVLSGQYRVAQAQQSGIAVPVGVALWASVSTAVDQRLSDLSAPWRLQPDEWRSGDIPWLVELVSDTRTQQALLKHLGETVFRGREIKMRVRDADGKMQIGTFKGEA